MSSQLLFSLCLLCFLSHSTFALQLSFNSSITTRKSFVSSFTATANVGSPLSLSLQTSNSSTNFTFCARKNFQPPQNPYYWSSSQCDLWASLTAPNFTAELDSSKFEPAVPYYFALASNRLNVMVNLSISASDCNVGSLGPNCAIIPSIATESYKVTFNSSLHTFYGELQLAKLLYSAKEYPQDISFSITTEGNPNYDVLFTLGSNSLPDLNNNHTVRANNTVIGLNTNYQISNHTVFLSLTAPSPNINNTYYYFALKPVEKKTRSSVFSRIARRRALEFQDLFVNFTWNVTFCPTPKKFGAKCENITEVNTTRADFGGPRVFRTRSGEWEYFSVRSNNASAPFFVTVQNYDGNGVAPALYLRYEQVPTEVSYDAISSQQNANSIAVGQHRIGRWFIGVKGSGAKYALWFNSPCPNGCNDHGSCVAIDDQAHSWAYKCQCNDDFESFDCSEEKHELKSAYVALILVGYLVGLTLGLVLMLWVCHRKKPVPVSYEAL